MIGLRGLPDGGHVLEHPGGPLYVDVRGGKIARAELAPWGSPVMIAWPSKWPAAVLFALEAMAVTPRKGGGATA